MTTQATFMTNVRTTRLDETTARMWTDTDLRIWINEGARDIARKTLALEQRFTVAGIISTAEYTLDPSMIQVSRVEFTPTGQQTYPLEYIDKKQFDNFGWQQRTLTSYKPNIYTVIGVLGGLKLITFPGPAQAGSFTIWGFVIPLALAETAATDAAVNVQIPQGYDDVLYDYIEFRALRKDRDPRWQEAKALYDENLGEMFDATRRWVDEAGVIMPQSGGMPAWLTGFGR